MKDQEAAENMHSSEDTIKISNTRITDLNTGRNSFSSESSERYRHPSTENIYKPNNLIQKVPIHMYYN